MTRPRSRARSALRRLRTGILPVPGQAAGLAAIVAVLTAALVSLPLMVGSAEEGAWERERVRHAESALGTSLHSSTRPQAEEPSPGRIARAAEFDEAVTAAATAAGLPAPVFQARSRAPLSTPSPTGPVRVALLFRTGAEHHVEIVAGTAAADGVLIPADVAAAAGLGPGDVMGVESQDGRPARLPVSGVYTPLTAPLPEFWETQREVFLPKSDPEKVGPVLPPPVVLAPRQLALATAAAVEQDLFLQWFVPVEPGIGVDAARATAARFERFGRAVADPATPVARLAAAEDFPRPRTESGLPEVLVAVDSTVALLVPPLRAVALGGAAAALVLVGAWAGQRVRHRDDELRALVVRGLPPARIAARGTGEAVLPVLLGAVAGAGAAWLLVRELGPSDGLPAGTGPAALTAGTVGAVTAVAVVACVTAVLTARLDRPADGRPAQRPARIPWLAVTSAVAVVALLPFLDSDADGRRLDLLTLGVPLLVTAVAAGALTALLPRIGRRADARLRRLPTVAALAVRRVLTARGASRLVVVSTALALGLTVYAAALGDSTARTVAAKEAVAAPGDVVVPLVRRPVEDGPLPAGATVVGIEQELRLDPGGQAADLLVVDPATFPDVVRWDAALADRPLDDLLAALSAYDGERVPVLVAGPRATVAVGDELTLTFFRYYSLAVEVVGRAEAFPGQASHRTVLVADWDRATAALEAADRDPARLLDRQVWATGEAAPVLDALSTSRYAYDDSAITTAGEFTARPDVRAQAWSLDYLRAVSVAAGLLSLVGVTMHALAQQRRRTVAALLLARMGLPRRSADAATALEIGLLTGSAAVVAVAVALPTSTLVVRLLDPVPALLPEPLFTVPWGALVVVLAGVLLVTAGSALLVGRAARRAVAGEVIRGAA